MAPPDSFLALWRSPTGRLLRPAREVYQRHELCEDLARALITQAQALHHDDGISEDALLLRFHQALSHPDAGLASADEAGWVVRRLAELLDWEASILPARQRR